ncbi:MAG: hypothetical protein HFE63_07670 [Clostridiales bacterium]|nr:hypothetical protein [Clostridiales bacterium]
MKTKLTSITLASVMLAGGVLVSCGDTKSPSNNDTSAPTSDSPETTSYYDTLNLPDFGGETFTILCRTDLLDEMYAEMENGDVVNDAVYTRNQNVSEKLNVDLQVIDVPGKWADKDVFTKYVSSSILANDDAFQVVAGYMHYMPATIQDDLYLDINTLPYIDLSQEWWMDGFNSNVTINDKMYIAMGDLCSSVLRYAFCGYANITLLESYNYDVQDLYTAVREGKWTFDMMTEMAKNVSGDINGDGKMDDQDLYGVGMHDIPIRSLTNAFAIDYTTRDSNGLPEIALYGERLISAYEKVSAACHSDYWLTVQDIPKFMSDNILFFFDVLNATSQLREMKSNYAVVPPPKYDENQENYRVEAADTTSILLVPVTINNPELVGAVLESLNYESYKTVTPAYFKTAMQGKYARDEESQEMMEIIRDSIYFDFGYVFAGCIGGGINSIMANALNDSGVASVWDSNKSTMETNLSKLLQFFSK